MLDELTVHAWAIQQQQAQQHISDLFSDLSDGCVSDSSGLSPFGSPISIDTPDILVSSDISLYAPSNGSNHSASISTDSDISISDLEEEYYWNWRHRYQELLTHITNTCVLQEGPPVPKSSQLYFLEHWRVYCPDRFCCKLQVEPDTFDGLVALIIDNPVFTNHSNSPQLPVHIQLSVFLIRAGHYGNAASPEDVTQWLGLSIGGVEKCTDRVVVALLSLHDDAIHFPDAGEKEDAKNFVERQTCLEWQNGFLLVDGTKIPLFQRPRLHGDAWYDKGGGYSIDCQVCCSTK
jgi:hypothetical protein